jgi:hypothetical protein
MPVKMTTGIKKSLKKQSDNKEISKLENCGCRTVYIHKLQYICIYMVLINNTYCGNSILMVFTSRTYLKQTRNSLDRSGNMFCVLQPSLYTPFHYLNRIHPSPFSFVKISHTLALSRSLTHAHIHSLNLAQSHQLRWANYIPTTNTKLINTNQNKSHCLYEAD